MAEEQVFVSQPTPPNQEGFLKSLFGNKKLLLVIGVIVVIELVWAYNALLVPQSTTSDTAQSGADQQAVPTASLKIAGPQSVEVGQTLPVDVVLQTQKEVTGVDAVIKYDTQRLELVASGSAAAKPGALFPDYPVNALGDTPGVVNISAVSLPGAKGFSGQGLFASLTFRVLRAGTAVISFDFTPNSESDSNIVDSEEGRDILEKADSLEVQIK